MTPRELAMAILKVEPKEDKVASVVIALDTMENFKPYPEIYARYKIRINYTNGEYTDLGKLELVGVIE